MTEQEKLKGFKEDMNKLSDKLIKNIKKGRKSATIQRGGLKMTLRICDDEEEER
jgi:hypothetical protein